ncbi:MAG TPA: glycosyltransferase, partial [Thermomicrobiales bacterium]|nr:glycosyltransferase [Thermomicrobiales bacterium]
MSFDLIRVCLFGRVDPDWLARIRLRAAGAKEADNFAIHACPDDADLPRILAERRPQVIVTLGPPAAYPRLMAAPIEIRRRWTSIDDPATDPAAIAERILRTFLLNATSARFPDEPLVSVFTPTYLTGAKIERPFQSLLAQTYSNWEWIVYDDSPDDGQTFARLSELARRDQRIAAFRADHPSGNIGEVKRRACGLARGALLVELDHDDALTPNALRWLVNARNALPEAGFFYTDCAEIFENGATATYPDGWAFGFGSYRQETLGGHVYAVANYPDVNA